MAAKRPTWQSLGTCSPWEHPKIAAERCIDAEEGFCKSAGFERVALHRVGTCETRRAARHGKGAQAEEGRIVKDAAFS